ncbi:Serine protease, subtilisin family [Asanoa hainanensis]|uniref:Serine protease, subtilisin family n=1 Tax=Asanoa hainanensis TaxID=560556 RepID=A0A239PI92_9ACTN|nr:S8 family peptidase [Asanoa hainanensis]SNT66059.1 Serine protease, subtilisin family [Asanoa hainanensis]
MRLPRKSILVGVSALTVFTFAAPSAAAEPSGIVRRAGGATAVAGSYIVVLKDNAVPVAAVDGQAKKLTGRSGGTAVHTFRTALRGFELKATAAQASKIAADPAVAYVEQNHKVKAYGTQTNPPSWGLDRIDQRDLPLNQSYTYPNTATNVHAYIIDTGIRTTHQDFGGRATSGFDAIDGGTADDCHGHGTHVAGTVGGNTYGVAKGVKLVAVRVLNCQGEGTDAQVIAGIDWVAANAVKPAVANMSLGGDASVALDDAVNGAIDTGLTFAIAAGNGDLLGRRQNACNYSPARVPNAITVGATGINDGAASFSNFGTCVDILGPGVAITSAWATSNTATNTINGTSMATPHVAGAAALVLSTNPGWTNQQVRDYLVTNSTPDKVINPGTDTPNRLLFVKEAPPASNFGVSATPTSGAVLAGDPATVTVGTSNTGATQSVALTASGLPAGATASFNPTTVTSGGSSTLTIATSGATPAGTYPVTITGTGTSGTRSATYTLTVVAGPGGCSASNGGDVAIPDLGSAVTSSNWILGCDRGPSSTSTVAVDITHSFRGDLLVDLVAPDGTVYRLKKASPYDSAANVNVTYTVNLAGESANGNWKLKVQDLFGGDAGTINGWTLTL